MAKALFKDDAKVKVLVKDNPKSGASKKRFAKYFNPKCKTVKDALALGITRGDLRWDAAREFIKIVS